ncbi:MAG: hypothetical protein M3Y37_02080 [Chloroflexota bacterium]|nr:hypothetical protein [Chloroflexota bacterium]
MTIGRRMQNACIAVVAAILLAMVGAWATNSLGDVSAAGRAGVSKVPSLFKDNGNKGGDNGNGNGNGNGQGNGNGNGQGNGNSDDVADDVAPEATESVDVDDDATSGKDKKGKKDKEDKSGKSNKSDKSDDDDEDSEDASDADDEEDDGKASGNVDCSDIDSMVDYLLDRNMNGAIHANENGRDNAALGALNKCSAPGQNRGDDEDVSADSIDGTPVTDGTPVVIDGTPIGDDGQTNGDITVDFDIDEDGNGTISYDLDGDGIVDLILFVEDGEVVDSEETGSADDDDDGTPVASPDA